MAPTTSRAKSNKNKSSSTSIRQLEQAATRLNSSSASTTAVTTTIYKTSTAAPVSNIIRAPKLNLPVYSYAIWLEENQLKRMAPWIAVAIAALVRWIVGLGPYSGMAIPPRYGDYEAQRHWMELTIHRPIREWYSDGSKWWDLDYPPLTAYVSWICGFIGNKINAEWFAWETSRGFESRDAKLYMRATVLVLEMLVYMSAIVAFTNRWFANKPWTRQHTALMLILLQPGLILIDSGHFQYNAVMLGLVVWALNCFLVDQDVLGSISFCLALAFKQMGLYFAPAVFAYLLGKSLRQGFFGCIWKLTKLGLTVILTLVLMFSPWLQSQEKILQVLHRIFPVFRGLYQDKVANIWCAVNVVIKLREMFDIQELVRISTLATLLSFLPSVLHLIARPTKRGLIYGLINSSLSFFLLSFQVHEKSILIPALPITLLILDEPAVASLFITLATFSMFPLLKHEGLFLQYAVLLGFWVWLTRATAHNTSKFLQLLILLNLLVITTMHTAEFMLEPSARYPDIFPVLNSLWSAAGFVLFWIYFNYRQFTLVNTPKMGFRVTKTAKLA
ncbi:ALG6, ALG8 glycosyltransferase family-domain-containing protein [Lobosporangium transversale]|uniref:Alpha-1,3-glucosyltransferase n=1 Tax=Lobosporangium transversale TaxID=64571 RepID=A0A1Y2GCG7_9FUNG|nr:ALG6, ALG8 glycosyltransferase family-domain-containing protein [Lobosporangium transversale]ORZ05167.1 ALG6, ALG8 glycosyltransferase family-domain-containing protein [Lobosporangium transversale]|eukprot:XP_021876942.1 ALG6, ALG8 glycosyltransferase family-domain-containing protein [Lobosporangium transversale]